TFVLRTIDVPTYGAAFSANMQIEGGTGFDTVVLSGNTTNVVFTATTMTGIERIQMEDGFSYTLKTVDANVAAGQTMQVDGSALNFFLNFNGSAELNGNFQI